MLVENVSFYQHENQIPSHLSQCENDSTQAESTRKLKIRANPPTPPPHTHFHVCLAAKSRYVCVWLQCFCTLCMCVRKKGSCSLSVHLPCFSAHALTVTFLFSALLFCFFLCVWFFKPEIQTHTHTLRRRQGKQPKKETASAFTKKQKPS